MFYILFYIKNAPLFEVSVNFYIMLVIPKFIMLSPLIPYLPSGAMNSQCSVELKQKHYNIFKSKSQGFKIKPFRFYCIFLFIRPKEQRLGIILCLSMSQSWNKFWSPEVFNIAEELHKRGMSRPVVNSVYILTLNFSVQKEDC